MRKILLLAFLLLYSISASAQPQVTVTSPGVTLNSIFKPAFDSNTYDPDIRELETAILEAILDHPGVFSTSYSYYVFDERLILIVSGSSLYSLNIESGDITLVTGAVNFDYLYSFQPEGNSLVIVYTASSLLKGSKYDTLYAVKFQTGAETIMEGPQELVTVGYSDEFPGNGASYIQEVLVEEDPRMGDTLSMKVKLAERIGQTDTYREIFIEMAYYAGRFIQKDNTLRHQFDNFFQAIKDRQ